VEYADGRARWRDGYPAVFPPGTYWLQRFASVLVPAAPLLDGDRRWIGPVAGTRVAVSPTADYHPVQVTEPTPCDGTTLAVYTA
jgi:hypothetical protein